MGNECTIHSHGELKYCGWSKPQPSEWGTNVQSILMVNESIAVGANLNLRNRERMSHGELKDSGT